MDKKADVKIKKRKAVYVNGVEIKDPWDDDLLAMGIENGEESSSSGSVSIDDSESTASFKDLGSHGEDHHGNIITNNGFPELRQRKKGDKGINRTNVGNNKDGINDKLFSLDADLISNNTEINSTKPQNLSPLILVPVFENSPDSVEIISSNSSPVILSSPISSPIVTNSNQTRKFSGGAKRKVSASSILKAIEEERER